MKTNKFIAEQNAAFQAASPEDKRRMIARDVIAQVHAKKYNVDSQYFNAHSPDECTVCGIGSCVASMERLRSKHPVNMMQIDARGEDWNTLEEYFGEEQLALIEEVFERASHRRAFSPNHTENVDYDFGKFRTQMSIQDHLVFNDSKKLFCHRGPNGYKKRLIQIMENIIRNGKFDYKEEIAFRSQPELVVDELTGLAKEFTNDVGQPKPENITQRN